MRRVIFALLLLLPLAILPAVRAQVEPVEQTWYINVRSARIREEATTRSKIVMTLTRNTAVTVIETVVGSRVGRSTTWYHIRVNDREGYIHSSLVTSRVPHVLSTPLPGATLALATATPAAVSSGGGGATCNGATTCGQMASCQQAYACMQAGNGRLDRDNDGVPCESICSGG